MVRISELRPGAGCSVLRHEEGVRLDPDRLLALFAELGEQAAESVVCRAIEELAVRLADIQRHAAAGDTVKMLRAGDLLAGVAAQVGMTTLARVAGDVCHCARRGDAAALGATLSRLTRIGDRSLTAVWELQDVTV